MDVENGVLRCVVEAKIPFLDDNRNRRGEVLDNILY